MLHPLKLLKLRASSVYGRLWNTFDLRVPYRSKRTPSVRVRIWNDIEPYKKIFVAQGFYDLFCQGQVELQLVDYAYFRDHGAPPPVGAPYHSHKNIVVLEVSVQDKVAKIVYDINDLYYKIPNQLLTWSDLYFKASYQPRYLETGMLLTGGFWDGLTIRPECLPEPLDTSQTHKILPCSASMVLYPSLRWNRRYIRNMTGLWHKSPPAKKQRDIFFLGRYWGDTKEATLSFLRGIAHHGLRLHGGVVEAEQIPEAYREYRHRAVSLRKWAQMCSEAGCAAMTRGLDGCISFKTLHILMVGAPLIAMRFQADFWQPILPDEHYFCVQDDFGDLGDIMERCDERRLLAMGRANLEHWRKYLSPEATAHYILDRAQRIV